MAFRARSTEAAEEKRAWFDRAIAAYEKSLAYLPNNADTLHNLGVALAFRARSTEAAEQKRAWFDRATAAYEQSLVHRPDDADTLDGLASVFLLRWRVSEEPEQCARMLTEAERVILRAKELDRDTARYNYCCLLSLKGEHDACLEELKVLLDRRPDRKKDVAEDLDFEPLSAWPEFQRLIAPHSWRPAAYR